MLCSQEVAAHFSAWQKAELARNPQRPLTLEYVERIFTNWSEIHGDRGFADDPRHGLRHGPLSRA